MLWKNEPSSIQVITGSSFTIPDNSLYVVTIEGIIESSTDSSYSLKIGFPSSTSYNIRRVRHNISQVDTTYETENMYGRSSMTLSPVYDNTALNLTMTFVSGICRFLGQVESYHGGVAGYSVYTGITSFSGEVVPASGTFSIQGGTTHRLKITIK